MRMVAWTVISVLFTTACVTETDFVPVKQPDLVRASHDVLAERPTEVRTPKGVVEVDGTTQMRLHGSQTDFVINEARRCWAPSPTRTVTPFDAPCTLTEPNTFEISHRYERADGDAWASALLGTLVVGGISTLIASNFVCLSDANCNYYAKAAIVTTDVVLGAAALTLGIVVVVGFAKAIHHGMNN
jgi:hypothetical protein